MQISPAFSILFSAFQPNRVRYFARGFFGRGAPTFKGGVCGHKKSATDCAFLRIFLCLCAPYFDTISSPKPRMKNTNISAMSIFTF